MTKSEVARGSPSDGRAFYGAWRGKNQKFEVSGYRAMWAFVMFDLPVKTKTQRKAATDFRKKLLEGGFSMMQFSVYIRNYRDKEILRRAMRYVEQAIPPGGKVSIVPITDKQYENIVCFIQAKKKTLQNPAQLTIF